MPDTTSFAVLLLLGGAIGLAAVLSHRLTERVRIPSPALVLLGVAVAVRFLPSLRAPSELEVEHIVTVALVFVLFEGGMHIGWSRFKASAGPIVVLGILGTFLTAGAAALLCHFAFGFDWYIALLVGTAVAPTDPAVVFSVLGRKEMAGRAGSILEGESGANDPVGIALMASLVAAGSVGTGAFGAVGIDFLLQMVIGAGCGLVGGRLLLVFMRNVPLPGEGLYPLRTMACAVVLFGATTLAHGSGFLAVFVAGIVLGDETAPFKREIARFHGTLAALGEIVAFVVLGFTVNLHELAHLDVWLPGVVLGAAVSFVLRPALILGCLVPARLKNNERTFVLFSGLKGAVPILLGGYLLSAHVAGDARLYGIVVVVVGFSVIVQGSLVPSLAAHLRLPMRAIEPEPFAFGVRLRNEPNATYRMTIGEGARADGARVDELRGLPEQAWIALVLREGELLPVKDGTALQAGDDVTVLAGPGEHAKLAALFEELDT